MKIGREGDDGEEEERTDRKNEEIRIRRPLQMEEKMRKLHIVCSVCYLKRLCLRSPLKRLS